MVVPDQPIIVIVAISVQTVVLRYWLPSAPPTPPEPNCTCEVQEEVSQIFVNSTSTQTQLPHDWLLLLVGVLFGIVCIVLRNRIEDGRLVRAQIAKAAEASRGEGIHAPIGFASSSR